MKLLSLIRTNGLTGNQLKNWNFTIPKKNVLYWESSDSTDYGAMLTLTNGEKIKVADTVRSIEHDFNAKDDI